MWTMPPRDTDFDFEKETKTLRFSEDERALLRELMRRVRGRSRLAAKTANPSNLIKEMMGLSQMGLLTDEDRQLIAGDAPPSNRPLVTAKLERTKGRKNQSNVR